MIPNCRNMLHNDDRLRVVCRAVKKPYYFTFDQVLFDQVFFDQGLFDQLSFDQLSGHAVRHRGLTRKLLQTSAS